MNQELDRHLIGPPHHLDCRPAETIAENDHETKDICPMSLNSIFVSRIRLTFKRLARIDELRSIAAQAREYKAMLFWLIRDVFGHFRWRSFRMIFSGAAHLVTKFAAMG